jgi:diguanylate cyclase (GGDEF)-like protein
MGKISDPMEIGTMQNKLCLLVCRNYFAEVNKVIWQEGFTDVTVKSYPQICIDNKNTDSILETILSKENPPQDQVFISDDCPMKGIFNRNFLQAEKNLAKPESQLPRHCLQMFANRELVEYFSQNGAYLVTPGWLANWKTILAEWGFSPQTAKMFFQESSTRIILLETFADPQNNRNLTEFAEYVDLPYRIIPVGLDHFRLMVSQMVMTWRMKCKDGQTTESLNMIRQQLANYALAFDMLANLTRMMAEEDAVQEIKRMFSMLFAPQEMTYISLAGGRLQNVFPLQTSPEHAQALFQWAISHSSDYHLLENKDGFFLRISYQSETLGVIEIQQIAFPQYYQQYLNMGLVLAPLCGLVISNARAYQKIKEDEILLHQLASLDSLTNLYNRRYFYEVAEVEFKRAQRYNRPLSTIMIDIDFFKEVNDSYSHAVGDRVLVEVSRILTSAMRESDIRGRLGGEEFVILLPETNVELAQSLAERLRKSVAEMVVDVEETPVKITISLGVACLNSNTKTLDELLHFSDLALFKAKRNGRNQMATWTEPTGNKSD